MPYNPEKDEYFWLGPGYTELPKEDGTGYHPEYPSPSHFQAWFEINQHTTPKSQIVYVMVGKFYKSKTKIQGVTTQIDMATLQKWAVTEQINGPLSEEYVAAKLLHWEEEPEKVVGIFFRILD